LIAITQTGAGMAWAIETHREAGRPLAAGIGDLIAASFDPTGHWLACASDNQITVWDIASHRPAGWPIRIGDGETLCGLAVAPDGRWCATGRQGGAIHLTPIPERR
jgi:WD40 repeat protein